MRLEKSSQPNDEAEPELHSDTSPDGPQCRAIKSSPEKVSGAWFSAARACLSLHLISFRARIILPQASECSYDSEHHGQW